MDDRQPLGNQSTADSKGSRKRKHSEMMKQQLDAFSERNGDEDPIKNLMHLVLPGTPAYEVHRAEAEEAKKFNDLLLASQEVGKTLNSLLDKIQ